MISVSYQGEPGAFSERAARGFFGRACRPVPAEHFRDVFESVKRGRTSFGVIPIENTVFGSVHENYDLLLRYNVFIVGEVSLRVRHHLLALPGVKFSDIHFVFSHPQAIGQCENFLHSMNKTKVLAYYDTAGAAKMIREEGRRNAAAIASLQAARAYRLFVLRRNIEQNHQNYTRFLILGRKPAARVRRAKTSLVFSSKNIPGSLYKALAVFALRDVNLLKIESRPLKEKAWEYLFYLDVVGGAKEERVLQALNHLKEVSTFVRVLGSYPRGRVLEG